MKWLLALLLAGIVCAGCRSGPPENTVEEVRHYTGLRLPPEASGIHLHHCAAMTFIALVKFEIPESRLAEVLGSTDSVAALPGVADLSDKPEIADEMVLYGRDIPWWTPAEARPARAAQRNGAATSAEGYSFPWFTMVSVVELGAGQVRVYVLLAED